MKAAIILFLFFSWSAHAAPVLNINVASGGNLVTIWPDHADPDQYYFAPNSMKIAKKDNGQAAFSLVRYNNNSCLLGFGCQPKAILTTFFEASYNTVDLQNAMMSVMKLNPKARFSPIPLLSTRVSFGNALNPFLDGHECSPVAGQTGDIVPCTLILNNKGIKKLIPALRDGKFVAFNFLYELMGVADASGKYVDKNLEYSIVVNLGGDLLVQHPDLQD